MISPRTLRTAIGRTSASYPVPFLGVTLYQEALRPTYSKARALPWTRSRLSLENPIILTSWFPKAEAFGGSGQSPALVPGGRTQGLLVLLGSGLVILVLSIKLPAGSAAFWAFFSLALLLFTSAVALIAFAVIIRPDLLRNDRTAVMQQVMGIFSDDETGDRIERVVSRYLEQPRSTSRGSTQRKQRQPDRLNDGDDDDA